MGLLMLFSGMKILTKGLHQLSADNLYSSLKTLQIGPLKGLFIGTIVTSLLQSSSGTTIMIISLVEANIFTLNQASFIIMGANIGTTLTSQLIAFQLSRYAPYLLLLSLFLALSRRKAALSISKSLLGFGFIFMSIHILSQGTTPLKDILKFQQILQEMGTNPLLGILMGFSTTAIIQSSSTAIALLQSLAISNVISFPAAAAILLGLNIGTCVTTLLASIPLSITAKRAAIVHLLFNLFGVIIIFPFIRYLCSISIFISPNNISRQIANAHTFFNLFSTLLFIPFASLFVKAASFIIKE
jgi:phosphate:Na+ symporter